MYDLFDIILIPVLGMLAGIIIPIAAFIMVYYDNKHKKQTIIEIAKHLDNPVKINELVGILDERKKEPLDYRRGGVITLFVGIGIYLFGLVAMLSLIHI